MATGTAAISPFGDDMTVFGKKNPPVLLAQAWACWWSLRKSGAFCWGDAWMNWRSWLLPSRFAYRAAGRALARETTIQTIEADVHQVTLKKSGLKFFWIGKLDNNVYWTLAQEFDPTYPHYYTTPPIRLTPESIILDVGACEGLFAYRTLRQGLAAKVICFEPSERTADYLRRGATMNAVEDRLITEVMAVSHQSGRVGFAEGDSPTANRIVSENDGALTKQIPAVTLDQYCAQHRLVLGPRDLIKVDAEGADFDVLRGAEQLIRQGKPQITVTTYHLEAHAREILTYLRSIQPAYRFRLKGLTRFGPVHDSEGSRLRPVLLQAAFETEA